MLKYNELYHTIMVFLYKSNLIEEGSVGTVYHDLYSQNMGKLMET